MAQKPAGGLTPAALSLASIAAAASVSRQVDLPPSGPSEIFTPERGHGSDLGTMPDADGRPFFFSIAVPEGNYRVSVTLGHGQVASSSTVKAESRRLMLENVATGPGQYTSHTFTVNVRHSSLPPAAAVHDTRAKFPAVAAAHDKRANGIGAVVNAKGEHGCRLLRLRSAENHELA